MKLSTNLFFIVILLLSAFSISSQSIKGRILDGESSDPVNNIILSIEGTHFEVDQSGSFSIPNQFTKETLALQISSSSHESYLMSITNSKDADIELGILFLTLNNTNRPDALKGKSSLIDNGDNDSFDNEDNGVSSLLSASWDPFGSLADFNFRITRFRPRGLGQEQSEVYLNGLQFNNLRDGRYSWSLWGGLNDMFRSRYSEIGMNSTDYAVGALAGMQNFDLRSKSRSKRSQLTMDHSNRSYQYRTMLSHNSGVQANGWSYSLMLSKRWGQQGYIEGTYYDAYAYFASVDKALNEKHSISLAAFASPSVRGRSGNTTQVMYDLVEDNFYNPNWGYQNGKIRNSREYRSHQPVVMLRHDYEANTSTSFSTSVGVQFGYFGSTRLGWLEAPDPRPDYYGNLPYDNAANLSESDLNTLTQAYKEDESIRQIDWDKMYDINRSRKYGYRDEDGQLNEENISAYILEEQRFDNRKIIVQSHLSHTLNTNSELNAGASFRYDRNHNYKLVDDLLGGSHFLDIDGFALRESRDFTFLQNDIDRPNRLLSQGDRFGTDYYIHNTNVRLWGQYHHRGKRLDFNLRTSAENTNYYREGLIANGKFPNNSKGKSEVVNFNHGTVKAGLTYKINGRNYIYSNLSYMTRAPFSSYTFESADTRNSLVRGLSLEKFQAGELGYILRHPKLNARATFFYINSKDGIEGISGFLEGIGQQATGAFANIITSGIDKLNYGLEFGLDYKLSSVLNVRYAAALGEYIFTSRPEITLTIDNSGQVVTYDQQLVAYLENFNQDAVPQVAHTLDFEYRSPAFWSLSVNFNYFDDIYIDQNPLRRTILTSRAVKDFTETKRYDDLSYEELLDNLVSQEKYKEIFSIDLFAKKSFRWKQYDLDIQLSVNNLLDKQDIIYSGFEQLRFDFIGLDQNRFAARYNYAYGRNYSVGLKLKL